MVAEGSAKRAGAGCCCCWNFGNASTNNCYGPSGQMNALFLGDGYWGSGAGDGPWFMGDFEAGVWAGGTGASNAVNNNSPSMTMNYAFGILKTRPNNYAIRVANAKTGSLTTAYDGGTPTAFPNGRGPWTAASFWVSAATTAITRRGRSSKAPSQPADPRTRPTRPFCKTSRPRATGSEGGHVRARRPDRTRAPALCPREDDESCMPPRRAEGEDTGRCFAARRL